VSALRLDADDVAVGHQDESVIPIPDATRITVSAVPLDQRLWVARDSRPRPRGVAGVARLRADADEHTLVIAVLGLGERVERLLVRLAAVDGDTHGVRLHHDLAVNDFGGVLAEQPHLLVPTPATLFAEEHDHPQPLVLADGETGGQTTATERERFHRFLPPR